MKKYLIYAGVSALLLATSCTKNFEKINTDPLQYSPANFDANFFLSSSQRTYADAISGYSGPILFQSGWAQIFAMATTTGDYYTNADKYVESSNTNSYIQSSWNNGYRAAALANEIVVNRSADPNAANLVSIATIMKVLSIQYVTDVYGDVPYSEALKAKENNTLPVYDAQQAVYTAALTDLENAVKALDPAKPKPTADITSLAGDVAKWKRFGYSLMLRMAMRLVKKDAAAAKTWAEKAYAGGTLAAGEDVYIRPDNANGFANANVNAWLVATDFYQVRWSKTLIDYLKGATDPRLTVIAEVPEPGLTANNNQMLAGDKSFAAQIGQPNGYDQNTGSPANIANAPGYPGTSAGAGGNAAVGKYSRPSIDVYANRNNPVFVMTYAESELLLAEAAVRGWSVGASAAVHYRNGVSGGLQSINANKPGAISAGAADAYAATHPLDISSTENSLKAINTQYWATTGILWNFGEAWINWKRSGYPVLTPVNSPGNFSNGTIPRRQPYPLGESTANRANYTTAVSGLTNGDTFQSRVWWDQ
ncbi:MAG: SusD/RagB family nutrient-binding outer membrane lipoprotein [Sphingobacteriales bacterium]|nr:MAG: SusD/RagB family nutrient-binding outer membrane lipoprotein [Sphingobacteriales bacterium]